LKTRLSQYAEGIMEAAWLAAIIVVPVFFNVYSSRIFEPDKITLLRTLALVILAAWLTKLIEVGGVRWERLDPGESRLKTILRIPLVTPVIALAVVYILATIFSVTPRVSLWGSYQRLQGTYTMVSYIVVFTALVVNLRHRAQIERLIGTAILASLPVSLYGVLQRFGIDPIPWGGDVVARIASNMGNSIFVAAFLVMVFPLTFIRIVESFEALLTDRGQLGSNFVRATVYVFILALQAIAIYYSGSRGPWLGWAASLVFIGLGLSLIWRARWLTIVGVVLAIVAGAFLITLNIPNGPLENVSNRPEFARVGTLLDAGSRTGRVRTLIWQGASDLVQPHEPLEFPSGDRDNFNFMRPLIGYGPESMYVAYNRFYPPELTQVEKRNASPDRSHNETWDSLVITGVFGLIAYLTLFGSVIYFGLKWLGLIKGRRQIIIFLSLFILSGVLSAVIFSIWRGVGYLGVALPFGMVFGMILYLIVFAIFGKFEILDTVDRKLQAYLLLGLLAGIIAHWVEINFGIAIAATRTYFWVYTGMLLLIGYILPLNAEFGVASSMGSEIPMIVGKEGQQGAKTKEDRNPRHPQVTQKGNRSNKGIGKRKRRGRNARGGFAGVNLPIYIREALIVALIVTLILITLGYDFITNTSRQVGAMKTLWSSLTELSKGGSRTSYGVLALLVTTWLVGVFLLVSESVQFGIKIEHDRISDWLKMIAIGLGVSLVLAIGFWLWHASGLSELTNTTANTLDQVLVQVKKSEGLLTSYYLYLFAMVFGLALILPIAWSQITTRLGAISMVTSAVAFVVAFGLSGYTNMRVIQADIAFKTAELFNRPGQWPVAIEIYNHANDLAPNEDYYYLFLGRAYLEHAKTLQDEIEREKLIAKAESDLLRAQNINPLNTDHTANLARLYSLWTAYSAAPPNRQRRAQLSDEYFSKAVSLSPNNARLWDEWAVLNLNSLQNPEKAYQQLQRALELDPNYDWTYGLLGDYLIRYVANAPDVQESSKADALILATDYYSQALMLVGSSNNQLKFSYASALGGLLAQSGKYEQAIEVYLQAIQAMPNTQDRWRVEFILARIYAQIGDIPVALQYAQSALTLAPEDQKEALQNLIVQLGGE